MTDIGTTAIQVSPNASPVTEDEMNHVQSILSRAANAIVDMSRLTDEVSALRVDVAKMKHDITTYTQTIEWQSETISKLRAERDQAVHDLAASNAQIEFNSRHERETEQTLDVLRQTHQQQSELVNRLTHERDDALLNAMQLEEDLKKAAVNLDKLHQLHVSIFGEVSKASPKETGEAVAFSYPSTPAPEMLPVIHDPEPVVEEAPKPYPEPLTSEDWKPGYSWDHARGLYVETVHL